MRHSNQAGFRQQIGFLRRQFLQSGKLPFSEVLSEDAVASVSATTEVWWLDRIFTPFVTLWLFLGQVLSADHSCRAAVARLIAHRVSRGERPCSAETGAYCQTRQRLSEEFFSKFAQQTGTALESQLDPKWRWREHRVYVYDGSTVTMPDTRANQHEYPQNVAQQPGRGLTLFPRANRETMGEGVPKCG